MMLKEASNKMLRPEFHPHLQSEDRVLISSGVKGTSM